MQFEARKGQAQVQLLAEVNIDSAATRSTPSPAQDNISCTRPVDLACLCPVTEEHMRKFRDAARAAARSSVSTYTRAQVQAKALFEGVALHSAAAQGDSAHLADMLRRPEGVDVNGLSAQKGRSVLSEVCGCRDEEAAARCAALLLRHGADIHLADAPSVAPAEYAVLRMDLGRELMEARPVHIAAIVGNLACLRLLLKAQADPLMHAAALPPASARLDVGGGGGGGGGSRGVGKPERARAGVREWASPLQLAAACGHLKCVEVLLTAAVAQKARRQSGAVGGGAGAASSAVKALQGILEEHLPFLEEDAQVQKQQAMQRGMAHAPGSRGGRARVTEGAQSSERESSLKFARATLELVRDALATEDGLGRRVMHWAALGGSLDVLRLVLALQDSGLCSFLSLSLSLSL